MVSSGYKAGLVYATLPEESVPLENNGHAVDLNWLKKNWGKWGYYECPIDEVFIIENRAPESAND